MLKYEECRCGQYVRLDAYCPYAFGGLSGILHTPIRCDAPLMMNPEFSKIERRFTLKIHWKGSFYSYIRGAEIAP